MKPRRCTRRTEDDGYFLVGLNREGVGHAALGEDDDGPVERGAHPGDVRVPQERAPLPRDGEVVHVDLPRPDRALRHVRRPVRPPRPQLPNAVPARGRTHHEQIQRKDQYIPVLMMHHNSKKRIGDASMIFLLKL